MTDPTLVLTDQREGRSQVVVNFGVFAGREATEAEIFRLAQSLLEDLDSVEIVAEHRFEFDSEVEATIDQACIVLPRSADESTGELSVRVENWAARVHRRAQPHRTLGATASSSQSLFRRRLP